MNRQLRIAYHGSVYSQRALAALTGVHTSTLASWRARFGEITESRVDKHLKRLSESAALKALATQHGVSASTLAKRQQRGLDAVDAATLPITARKRA